MSLFPQLETESVIQVGDRTRLSAAKSFAPGLEITKVEIDPDGDSGYFDVTDVDGWYLDWVYETAGAKTPWVKLTCTLPYVETEFSLTVIASGDDVLLSTDQDLKVHESDILDLLKPGRSTFKDVHRRARKLILYEIYEENIKNGTGNEIEIEDIFDTEALKDWSTYKTLRLIFFDNIVSVEDKFESKSDYYRASENSAKIRALASIEFDEDQDSEADVGSPLNFSSVPMRRR